MIENDSFSAELLYTRSTLISEWLHWSTLRENVPCRDTPAIVTDIVYVVSGRAAVALPEMTHIVASKVRPAGSAGGSVQPVNSCTSGRITTSSYSAYTEYVLGVNTMLEGTSSEHTMGCISMANTLTLFTALLMVMR